MDHSDFGMLDRENAVLAYRAYGEATGGVNFRGEPMPEYMDLGDRIQLAWTAAAHAVRIRTEDML